MARRLRWMRPYTAGNEQATGERHKYHVGRTLNLRAPSTRFYALVYPLSGYQGHYLNPRESAGWSFADSGAFSTMAEAKAAAQAVEDVGHAPWEGRAASRGLTGAFGAFALGGAQRHATLGAYPAAGDVDHARWPQDAPPQLRNLSQYGDFFKHPVSYSIHYMTTDAHGNRAPQGQRWHLLEYPADGHRMMLGMRDMEDLIKLKGLVRISSNRSGFVTFYFAIPE